jgi:predicted AlkP superfamily pyrophosphatase or phosphodiesterase
VANRVCVIDMPGLSRSLLPFVPADSALGQWLAGKRVVGLTPSFPAVTCSVQATLTTGRDPVDHGIVANGLPTFRFSQDQGLIDASHFGGYRRQISFWEQSNQFLDVPRFWQDAAGKSRWKTAILFFQNSMPGFAGNLRPAADIVLTPKPDHGPDGKLTSLCWSNPADLVLRLFQQLGPFPLMNYWGPMAGIASSQWIAKSAEFVWRELGPQLQWVYIPHLDYDLQRFGPDSPQAQQAVRDAATALQPLIQTVLSENGKIVLLSEYAMRNVAASLQPNGILLEAGLLELRETKDGWLIDYEKSAAVAMVDHQVAHVYVKNQQTIQSVRKAFESAGVKNIFQPAPPNLRHRRAGDLVLVADNNAWFDYRWWSDAAEAPSFAKTVDIHRKPGYDPLELFWDPASKGVSQNAKLIRGSHGSVSDGEAIFVAEISGQSDLPPEKKIPASAVAGIIQNELEK